MNTRVILVTLLAIGLWVGLLVALILMTATAKAHEAPTGWKYDYQCCSNKDCRMVNLTPEEYLADKHKHPMETVQDKQGGYVYVNSGEFIAWDDKRVKPSPDGRTHICTIAGIIGGKILCLYVPDKGY